MAKQDKVAPARKQREEESVLLRSAESLGRMIGTLQRQLDGASRSMAAATGDVMGVLANGNGAAVRGTRPTTRKAAKPAKPAAARGRTVAKAKAGAVKAPAATKRAAASTTARAAKAKSAARPRAKTAAARKNPRGR